MEQFCHTLFTMTATAAVAALGVMLLRQLLKKVPRWITCALWLVVFLRMVCPVSFSLPVSLMPQTVSNGAVAERVLPVSPVEVPPQVTAAEAPTAPTAETTSETVPVPVVPQDTPAEPAGPQWPGIVFSVWAVGTAAAVLWAAVSYGKLRRRISDAVLIENNIYETDQIDTPFVCGLVKPRIYLPVGMNEADRRYVLLHEQAHIRRLDHLTKPLAYLILCVHWFNPILWLSYLLLCRDVEAACDQAVTHTFDQGDTAGYATALLHLGQNRTLPQAVPLAFGEENPKGRITGVLSYKKPAFWIVAVAVAACLAAAVLLLGNTDSRLDGHRIERGWVREGGVVVDFPEPMRQELIALLNEYGNQEVATSSGSPLMADDTICLSSNTERYPEHNYCIYETSNGIFMWHSAYLGGDQHTSKQFLMDEEFEPAYADWEAKLKEFLWVTRPDELYTDKGLSMKSNEDAAELIKRFGLKETIGGYTLQLLTAQDPHRLLVQVNDFPALHSDRTAMRSYFQAVTDVFCSLADGVKGIDWHFVRSDAPWATMSFDASPAQTQEDFQSCYYRMEQAAGSYRPALNQTLFSDEILYLSPQLSNSVNVQQHLAISPNIYIFTFDPDRFDAEDLKNSSLQQAAWDGYSAPIYTITPLTDADRAALSAYLDLSPYTTQTCTTVHDSDGQDTGYRLYQMDTDVFILHFTTENGTQTLDYLIRLTEESQ